MVRVITISREFGSGGGSLARLLAQRLRWRLVDDDLVDEIARMGKVSPDWARRCDESLDPWFHRVLRAVWRGGFEGRDGTDRT